MMEQLTPVRSLFEDSKSFDGKTVRVGGWVRNLRASKNFGFINLSDGTYFSQVQIVFGAELPNFQEISKLNISAAVIVTGTLVLTPEAKQPFEIQASEISVEGSSTPDFPIQPKRHSMEFLRTLPHLRPRTNTFQAVFRVRSIIAYAIHKFFQERGFVYVHTPLITGSDCEGAGEFDRLLEGFLRQGDESDRVRSAERRGIRADLPQRLHLRSDLPRRKLQHHAPRCRVLDDRARDGVCRSVG